MNRTGVIYGINGPVIYLEGNTGFKMSEMVYVGREKLVGEVIGLTRDMTTVQVFEETTGIKPGELVEATGDAISVVLAPGILSNIFDGIERPLSEIAKTGGAYITRGTVVDSLDKTKLWDAHMTVKAGDRVSGGTILCEVQETHAIVHKVMVPPDMEGTLVKVMPDGTTETKTRRINPTIPISKEAQAIHGISQDDVKDCPTFKEIAKSFANWLSGCDIAGYNSTKFDIPLLSEEFLRAGVDFDFRKRHLVDVQVIFHKMEQRTLSAAYKFYCNKNLEDAHTAEADTRATYEVLKAQLDRYPELQNDIAFLADYSSFTKNVDFAGRMVYDDNGDEVFNFGKYKGMKVADVLKQDPGYYGWILNSDFTLNTKAMLTKIRLREMSNLITK